MKNWWKYLCIPILLATFWFGLTTPLKPGITTVHPRQLKAGTLATLDITGYNSNFSKEPQNIRAWLTDSLTTIQADLIKVIDNQRLIASFTIPELLHNPDQFVNMSLLVDHPVDGISLLPSGIIVEQLPNLTNTQVHFQNAAISGLSTNWAMTFPYRSLLEETIRNTYFHVPLWFAMIFLFLGSAIYAIRFLVKRDYTSNLRSVALAQTGLLFGVLGVVTGMIWAHYTWGKFWNWDIKQSMTTIALLMYLAYFILRQTNPDSESTARTAAAYNVFCFVMLIPLLYVFPNLSPSLHPGAAGNPGFGGEDLDNTMRMIFYPAIIGWTILGFWMTNVSYRQSKVFHKLLID